MTAGQRRRIEALSDEGLARFVEMMRGRLEEAARAENHRSGGYSVAAMALCQAIAETELRAAQLRLPV